MELYILSRLCLHVVETGNFDSRLDVVVVSGHTISRKIQNLKCGTQQIDTTSTSDLIGLPFPISK
jgi:hypothetical protein